MKKIAFLIPIFTVVILLFVCTQCKEDTSCKMKVTCRFSTNGIDTGAVVKHAYVKVGKETNAPYAKTAGYTDQQGVFTHTFELEALLDVVATYVDSVDENTINKYSGTAQIKLIAGEEVEKTVLLVPYED
ncbi:MAG: hypothetical protein RR356_00765 [Bacteroidales bacterium]